MQHKIKSFLVATIAAYGLLAASPRVYAQTIFASNPESFVASGATFPNSAAIDYTDICSACTNPQLTAVSYDVLGTGNLVYVNDGVSNLTISISGWSADVALGHVNGSSDYYLAVVYNATGGSTGVALDVYTLSNVGTGSMTVTGLVTRAISSTGAYPRIDVIADYSNLSAAGYPESRRFVMTYENFVTASVVSVEAYWADLSAPGSGTNVTITSLSTSRYFPDVAAVQRYNPVKNVYYDVAMFTYIDYNTPGSNVYYNEYNFSASVAGTEQVIDNNRLAVKPPKIAGIDDYSLNDPSSSPAYYAISYTRSNYATPQMTKNMLYTPASGILDISSAMPTPNGTPNTWVPAISEGPCGTYVTAYSTDDITNDAIAVSVDWTTGYPLGWPSYDWYQMNYYTGASLSVTTQQVTVAGICNAQYSGNTGNYLVAGMLEGSSSDLYIKSVGCSMAFKHAPSATAINAAKWELSPNPATDVITLTLATKLDDAQYTITDMAGRQVAAGAIIASQQPIAINELAPGIYLLHVLNDGQKAKTFKFVKN